MAAEAGLVSEGLLAVTESDLVASLISEADSCEGGAEGIELFSFSEGNVPLPFNSQYNSTSGNCWITFITKSKLGLFLPESKCEMVDLLKSIASEKAVADNP